MSLVPILVTIDLEVAPDHCASGQRAALEALNRDLSRRRLAATFFATAEAAELFSDQVVALVAEGHEIGCHGVAHSSRENLRCASPETAREVVREGTRRVSSAAGQRPTCFRGPFCSTSPATQWALVESGYVADFSVCSGRADIFGSAGGCPDWWWAPRRPYRPSGASPYRRGDLPLLVVPLSAMGIPFLSGVLYLMGLSFTKRLFDCLWIEAKLSGKPIVYLLHSYEFSDPRAGLPNAGPETPPVKSLHRLYRRDRQRRYDDTLHLLDYMLSHDEAVSFRAGDYSRLAMDLEAERQDCHV